MDESWFKENAMRLTLITNKKMNKPVLNSFFGLTEIEKKKFNRIMNEYIQSKPDVIADFNLICEEDVFDKLNPQTHNVIGESELWLTDEQKKQMNKGEIFIDDYSKSLIV